MLATFTIFYYGAPFIEVVALQDTIETIGYIYQIPVIRIGYESSDGMFLFFYFSYFLFLFSIFVLIYKVAVGIKLG